MALTNKQRAFINEYLKCWNASEAARVAEYAHPGSQGHRLLKNVEISEEIERRVAEMTMTADEVLVRLTEQARADYSQYITGHGTVDMNALVADGKAHLIKAIKETQHATNIEFYDAQSALVKIGERYGLFKHQQEVDSRVTLRIVYGDDRTDDSTT